MDLLKGTRVRIDRIFKEMFDADEADDLDWYRTTIGEEGAIDDGMPQINMLLVKLDRGDEAHYFLEELTVLNPADEEK